MRSRRALLAAAPVALLAGCGSNTPGEQDADPNVDLGTQRAGDVALLSQLLRLEPDGDAADALKRAIVVLGGRPPSQRRTDPDSPEAVGRIYAQYLDVVPKLADGRLRELCAGILADKARRIAQLRVAAGRDAVPEAFVV